jgi:hypothetical protein
MAGRPLAAHVLQTLVLFVHGLFLGVYIVKSIQPG